MELNNSKTAQELMKYTAGLDGLIGATAFEDDGTVIAIGKDTGDAVCAVAEGALDPEIALHLDIYESRRDVFTVFHFECSQLGGYEKSGKLPNLNLLPETAIQCGKLVHDTFSSFLLSDRSIYVSKEYGIFVTGKSPRDVHIRYQNLLRCVRVGSRAERAGLAVHFLSEKHITVHNLKVTPPLVKFQRRPQDSVESEMRKYLAERVRRCCEKDLFSIVQGTLSVRLSEDSFLITPRDFDRASVKPHELVLVTGEQCESGKEPSRSALLHHAIYKEQPNVRSIMIALPEAMMVSACTASAVEGIERFPFGASVMQPMLFSKEISLEKPIIMIENDCAIVLGTSIDDAIEKLDRAEKAAAEQF
ncbi:MAG: class II aldolase/adducin family protein [Clostridia bacterium]|nr:class II aldolase/adducin family protein [Clostridia bacterium]